MYDLRNLLNSKERRKSQSSNFFWRARAKTSYFSTCCIFLTNAELDSGLFRGRDKEQSACVLNLGLLFPSRPSLTNRQKKAINKEMETEACRLVITLELEQTAARTTTTATTTQSASVPWLWWWEISKRLKPSFLCFFAFSVWPVSLEKFDFLRIEIDNVLITLFLNFGGQ